MKTALGFVIFCSNRWLQIEMTARHEKRISAVSIKSGANDRCRAQTSNCSSCRVCWVLVFDKTLLISSNCCLNWKGMQLCKVRSTLHAASKALPAPFPNRNGLDGMGDEIWDSLNTGIQYQELNRWDRLYIVVTWTCITGHENLNTNG